MARRYANGSPKGTIHAIQVWNEPNLPRYWYPRPNATEYVKLLWAVSNAIKAEDPGAEIRHAAGGEILVDAGGAVRGAGHPAEGAGRMEPGMERLAVLAERILQALSGPGAVAVERDGESVDSDLGHCGLLPNPPTLTSFPRKRESSCLFGGR